MGFSKEEISKTRKLWSSLWRGIKTIFVLFTMFFSFLLVSAPIFLAVADALLPSALLHRFSSPATLSSHLTNYDFRHSLIDIPLISIIRSAVILCVYGLCDGPKLSRGPYLTITMICSISSLIYVSLKAAFVFGEPAIGDGGGNYFRAAEVALFLCSSVLAIGHIVVAYRTSCRERKKLLVFKIDIEAVSACKNVYPRYQKILLQQERLK
ncbi:hypothetical protein ISN44_As02g035220 [Arabidopsis suecica]|uniref:Alpha/beta hydrolase related protein n=2 Tax=Arabidopsis TaxID=3701 RepID=Q8GZ10_ARATH|nr:Alpha/beta hydrolase related protein [Arabidopsis thaliana]NP_850325.1 Alpha/beta hydrolase related protein [Arabidopsis thaliana]KAG7643748.1 hypothetical protein ISN44_As02g035220 [Arabidopsis suecica]AAP12861.1 At2g40095 [Arabidopsis thaliana]AEC09777.1 Alpha/beta hydrolase related protein [Arabidopsis thaliana]ANM62219.1 Alpha/beta hydrolase related protein [Arabidopsis thaliana]BAC41948.1 unknown protein [Arabidopsis thaliana]|eukprot:NP_001324394.1 Alpha/beta hydrolase related protein [Arabidopsis thaliana]